MDLATLPSHETRSYIGWHPYGDYLWNEEGGWASNIKHETWQDFLGAWNDCDDDLNLVADFYFEVSHDTIDCVCDGTGLNPATKAIDDDWYDFAGSGRRWCNNLHQYEVNELFVQGRLWDFGFGTAPDADEVNEWSSGKGLGHDSINKWICVEARARRLGIYGLCDECNGEGAKRSGPDRLVLNVWMLHPRKGAGRGVQVRSVQESDYSSIKEFLRRSHDMHNQHFQWVVS